MIDYRGQTFVERIEDVLIRRCDAVTRLGPGGLKDAIGAQGPMAGILAALEHDGQAWWLIAACDMPLISTEAVDWLLSQRSLDIDGVIPIDSSGWRQPLFALYHGRLCERIAHLSSPREVAELPVVKCPIIPADLEGHWCNVNTPSALSALP